MAENENNDFVSMIVSFLQTNLIRQGAFLGSVAASVALGIYLYSQIQDPMYRPLDYRVTDKNASVIADTLDKARITYKINDKDGIVMVPAKDFQAAKMRLASAGVPKDDSFGFSYLNDQNAIGESQFLENARYLRALEGDLAKTISAIDGISSARVHIAMPQNAVFADESGKPTASVFVTMDAGLTTDKEKIRSIIRIVASSVPGLDPKDVAITDQYGHYLADSMSPESIQSAAQMDYQNQVQNNYEKKIQSLISPLIGENKMNVRVHADVDFTQQEEAKEQYDPNQRVERSEETTSEEVGSQSASGPAGALANTPPVSDGSSGGSGSGKTSASSQGRTQSIKNYELGKTVLYTKSNVAKINAISVAVAIDNETSVDPKTKKEISKPIDKAKLDQITSLVKAAIGFNEKRGDVVTVVNTNFSIPTVIAPVEQPGFWMQAWFWSLMEKIGSIIFAFVMFMIVYRKANEHYNNIKKGAVLSTKQGSPGNTGAVSPNGLTAEMEELKQEQINRLKEIASRDPNRVALVIKNWVGDR